MVPTASLEWMDLWRGITELSDQFPEGLVFVGGVAVYLHVAEEDPGFLETTHDGDFCISLADFSELSALEEVTSNRRLSKHQIIKRGLEFDVYLERHSSLSVPYDEIQAFSVVLQGVRVACLEHLLPLKALAYRDKHGSDKGFKDERDLIRIMDLMATKGVRKRVIETYLSDDVLWSLTKVARSAAFSGLCLGNAHAASLLRKSYAKALAKVRQAIPKEK
jgi:hypothetical protein